MCSGYKLSCEITISLVMKLVVVIAVKEVKIDP